jgi:esterase/lipase
MCHGFAGTKVGRYRLYVRLSEALAAAGIASLRIDFRGCGDSEGNFIDTTFEGQVEDALHGLKHLTDESQIDSDRIGILGRSLGGPVAIVAARRYGLVKSVVLWASVYHGDSWKREWEEALSAQTQAAKKREPMMFQGQPINPQLFLQLLKLNMANELEAISDVPFLCVHSEKDEVVDLSHAHRFRESRESASGASHFTHLRHSSHDFSDLTEQEETIQLTVDWYRKTLLSNS